MTQSKVSVSCYECGRIYLEPVGQPWHDICPQCFSLAMDYEQEKMREEEAEELQREYTEEYNNSNN